MKQTINFLFISTASSNPQPLALLMAETFSAATLLEISHSACKSLYIGLWTLDFEHYVTDLSMLRFGRVEDGKMEFKPAPGGRNADAGVA